MRWPGAIWRRRAAWRSRPRACIRTIPPCTCCSVASRSRRDGVRTRWKSCGAPCGSIPWASRPTGCSATRWSRSAGSPRPWTSGASGSAWRRARRRSWRGSTTCAGRARPPRPSPARGRMADDVKKLSAELAQDPDSLVFLRLGELLRHKGQVDAAHRVALTGLERHPHLADAHDLYARILADKHDFERAFDEWDMALRIARDHLGALKGLAFLYFKVGDVQQAAAHLEAAQRVAPDDPGIAQALALAHGGEGDQAPATGAAELMAPAAAAQPPGGGRRLPGLGGAGGRRGAALVGGAVVTTAPPGYGRVLDLVTRVRGVRGAMLVAGDDGLVVAEQLMEGIKGPAVAALAASLASRLRRALEAAGVGAGQFWHLQAEQGALLVVTAASGVLVVAVAEPDVNVGLVRLELLRAAGGGGCRS